MSAEALYTLLILAGTLVLLVTDRVPGGVAGLLAIAALAVTGVLPASGALSGLTNSAVVTVACMYVLSAAVDRTGAAAMVANLVAGRGAGSPLRAYYGLLALTMLLSGFVNNTPLVLIFMPLVLGLASRVGEPPSRMLIPLSFVSILGGSCTLIGTSTNLIVASSLKEVSGGELEIGMFTFAPLGVVLALAGGAIVVGLRRRLLPERASLGLLTRKGVAVEYMTELELGQGSALVGRTLREVERASLLGADLRVLEVVRGEVIRVPRPEVVLERGDLLLVKGGPEAVLRLRVEEGRRAAGGGAPAAVRDVALTLFEVVVAPDSPWIGRPVEVLGLRDRFDVRVFAIQRHGAHLREQIERLRLHAGDVLLVQGSEDSLRKLRGYGGALVVEGVDQIVRHTRLAPLAALALALFVALAVSGLVAVEIAALLAALLVVLGGCISVRRAYESIGWDVLFLVAGTLAIGRAFEQTGLAEQAARAVVDFAAPFGTRGMLAAVLLTAALLTQVLSNNATAAMMTPLAWELGRAVEGASPLAFVVAVAFGANCSFLTPVSYKTNLIVYGPGGYLFRDFLRPGLPLAIVYLGLAILLLPILY